MLELKIKRLVKDLSLPSYAYPGDAALDLFAAKEISLEAGQHLGVPTGIALEIPEGYVGLIWDKSGLSIKSGLKTLGGVVDSGYRGEVLVGMINLSTKPHIFEKGAKVAQMLIQKKEMVHIVETESLSDSERDLCGFGSSGK